MTETEAREYKEALDFITEDEALLLSVLYDRREGDNGEGALLSFARILTPILRKYPAWLPLPPGFQEECIVSIGTGAEGLN